MDAYFYLMEEWKSGKMGKWKEWSLQTKKINNTNTFLLFLKISAILGLEFSLKIVCIYDVVKIAANLAWQ
ncbi:MAG TPA: hypothetical protein ENI82_01800 [Bacteroidetes bacterium]|nr:hypothetical protein [Bacteroidota bacterium]